MRQKAPRIITKFAFGFLSLACMTILSLVESGYFPDSLCSLLYSSSWHGEIQILMNWIMCIYPTLWITLISKISSIKFVEKALRNYPKRMKIILWIIAFLAFGYIVLFQNFLSIVLLLTISATYYSQFLEDALPSKKAPLLVQGLIALIVIVQTSVSSPFCWIGQFKLIEYASIYEFLAWGCILIISLCQMKLRKWYFLNTQEESQMEPKTEKLCVSWNSRDFVVFSTGRIRIEVQKSLIRNTIIRFLYYLCIYACTNFIAQLEALRLSVYISVETLIVFVLTLAYADLMRRYFFSLEDAFNSISCFLSLVCICNLVDRDLSMVDSQYFHFLSLISGITFALPIIIPIYFDEIVQRQQVKDEIKRIVSSLPKDSYDYISLSKDSDEVEMIQYQYQYDQSTHSEPDKSSSWDSKDSKSSISKETKHSLSNLFSIRTSVGIFFFSAFIQQFNFFKSTYFTPVFNDMLPFSMENKTMNDYFSPLSQSISSPIAILSTILLRHLLSKRFFLNINSQS